MARIRSIKPEFRTSKTLARVSRGARHTFVMLWMSCDDLGICLDIPRKLLGDLYPHDEGITLGMLNIELEELKGAGLIVRCSENNKDYIIVCSWDEHQKIDRPSKFALLSRAERDRLASVHRVCIEDCASVQRTDQEKDLGVGNGSRSRRGEPEGRTIPPDKLASPAKSKIPDESITQVLERLNSLTGSQYRPGAANKRLLQARLGEYSVTDLLGVVDRKVAEWQGTEFEKFLRPETLFGDRKCAQYVGELTRPMPRGNGAPRTTAEKVADLMRQSGGKSIDGECSHVVE